MKAHDLKVHYLPAEQQKRNDKAIAKLRHIGLALFALLLLTVILGAKLYIWPPEGQAGPRAIAEGGRYLEGVVLAPDLVLTPHKISGAAEFTAPGEHRGAHRLSSTVLPDGTEFTLLRLDSPTSVTPVAVVVIGPGENVDARLEGQEWHGVAREKVAGGYSLEPDFTLSPGTGIYREGDPTALAGFGFHTASGSILVPAQTVLTHFPELNGAH
jgi:hypothetical protein